MSKAKILTSYYRPKPGGLCKRLFRAINALLELGHEIHYLAVVPFPIKHERCFFHRFPWPLNYTESLLFWSVFHTLSPFILLYLSFAYKITHCFSFATNYALFLQPVRLFKNIPLVLFLRADNIENHKIKNRPSILIFIEWLIESIAIQGTELYCVSESLCRKVISRHRWSRPAQSGILRNDVQKITLQSTVVFKDPLRFVSVGILEKRKNQEFLLHLFSQLKGDNFHLSFYGSGTEQDYLEKLASELNVNSNVSFMGWVNRDDIWKNADVLLLPSLHEGAPNSALEALELNIPILASDLDEHKEILPECCLVSLSDISAWHNKLTEILSNPNESLNKLILEQKDYIERLVFNWNKQISSIIVNSNN